MLITSSTVPRKRRFQPNWFFRRRPHSGRLSFLWFWVAGHDIPRVFRGICPVAAIGPIAKTKNSVSLQLFCDCGLFSAPLGPKTVVFAAFWGCESRFGATRQSLIAKKLQSEPIFCFWAPGRSPETVLGRCRPDTGRGIRSIRGGVDPIRRCETRVALRAWVPARVSCCVIAFSKISNATLLKLVFRYNGRRGFVEDQASD